MEKKRFNIRAGTPKDIPAILSFVRELAKVEGRPQDVEATEKRFAEHVFGPNPFAEVLIAEYDNQPIGFALFFHKFSTFVGQPGIYLEDLYIQKAHRGKGYGKCLLKALAELAIERDCIRIDWSVLKENMPAIHFYESLDSVPIEDWTTYRLEGDALSRLAKTG